MELDPAALRDLLTQLKLTNATDCTERDRRRIVSWAVVVVVGIAAEGGREVLGFDGGDTQNDAFWAGFCGRSKLAASAGWPW